MTQNQKILKALKDKKKITRLIALHSFRVANITARIAELRRAGWEIHADIKRDLNGGRYAEYSLKETG